MKDIRIELEPQHVDAFKVMIACKYACKSIIEETAKHWEENYWIEKGLWERCKKHYKLDGKEYYFCEVDLCIKVTRSSSVPRRFKPMFNAANYVSSLFKKQ